MYRFVNSNLKRKVWFQKLKNSFDRSSSPLKNLPREITKPRLIEVNKFFQFYPSLSISLTHAFSFSQTHANTYLVFLLLSVPTCFSTLFLLVDLSNILFNTGSAETLAQFLLHSLWVAAETLLYHLKYNDLSNSTCYTIFYPSLVPKLTHPNLRLLLS